MHYKTALTFSDRKIQKYKKGFISAHQEKWTVFSPTQGLVEGWTGLVGWTLWPRSGPVEAQLRPEHAQHCVAVERLFVSVEKTENRKYRITFH